MGNVVTSGLIWTKARVRASDGLFSHSWTNFPPAWEKGPNSQGVKASTITPYFLGHEIIFQVFSFQ